MNKKKKNMFRSFAQRLKLHRDPGRLQTSVSDSNVPCLDPLMKDVSMVAMPPTPDDKNDLSLVITRKYSVVSDQQGSDSDMPQPSPDSQTASLPVTPVNSPHLIIRTQSWKEPRIWSRSPDIKMKQRRSNAGLKQMLSSKRDTFLDTDLCMMREDLDYWVFMRDGIDIDVDFEVKRVANYETYVDELLEEGAACVSGSEHSRLMTEIRRIRHMVNPDQNPDEMTKLQKGTAPDGSSDCSDNRSLNHVQEMFPNDNLQLYVDDGISTPKPSNLGRRKSAPGALILRRSKQRSFSSVALPSSAADGSTNSRRSSSGGGGPAARMYILEGPVQLTNSAQAQDRYLFLFSDLLLVAKQKSSNVFRLKQRVHVCDMWTASCIDDVAETTRTPDKSFVMGWPTVNVVATFKTADKKTEWLTKLQEQIRQEKEKEETKSVVIRVMNKEEGHNVSHDLEVANSAEARDVVKQCMDLFHITDGNFTDYKLWVRSAKDDSFYPLIGHELPFSIQMSKIREAHLKSDSENLPNHLDDSDTSLLCQFILRDMRKTPKKLSMEDGLKNMTKRKKSPLINFFRKKLHDLSPMQTPDSGIDILPQFPEEGRLFGRPLVEICKNPETPKPIMELLQYLVTHGPSTIGIFRKCANQKTVRELREQLDSGSSLSVREIPVLVAAAVLKDFLRSTPDCVFMCSFYHKWIATMNSSKDNDRVLAIQQLLPQLPSAHHRLLTCVMFLLHRISENSDENCMTSFNLAVCIGQSLLWQHGDTATTNTDKTSHADARENVPRLIEFIIEHCLEIFECPSVDVVASDEIGDSSVVYPLSHVTESSTDSDSMHSMLATHERPCHLNLNRHNDSSLDSLERDLYGMEGEISPQMNQKHLSPTNLSRDSGLTNSDTQLYSEDALESEKTILAAASVAQRIPPSGFRHSVSQVEGAATETMSDNSNTLSKSFDSTLLGSMMPTPVPPKRKARKKGPSQSASPTTSSSEDKTGLPKLLPLIHSDSTPVVPSPLPAQKPLVAKTVAKTLKRESDNQVTRSFEDYSDISCNDFLVLQGNNSDMGELRRSNSGASMYINGHLIHRSNEPPSDIDTEKRCVDVAKDDASLSPPIGHGSGLLPVSHSFSDFQQMVTSEKKTQKTVSRVSVMKTLTATKPLVSVSHSLPMTVPINEELKSVALVMSAVSSMSHAKQRQRSHDLSHPSYSVMPSSVRGTKRGSLVHQPCSLQSCDLPVEVEKTVVQQRSPPQTVASTQVILRKRSLKGMTCKGADVFPAASNLYRIQRSIEESRTAVAPPVEPQKSRSLDSTYRRSRMTSSSSNELLDDVRPEMAAGNKTLSHVRLASSVERSSSDSHVEQQMAQQMRCEPQTLPHYHGDHRRSSSFPRQPSSDREITLDISEEEILEQTLNSARAKRMYEESLQQYVAQLSTTPIPKVMSNGDLGNGDVVKMSTPATQTPKKPLPDYEEACFRAEALKEEAAKNRCSSACVTEPKKTCSSVEFERVLDAKKEELSRKQSRLSARRRQAERHRAQRLSDTRLAELNDMKNGGSHADILRSKSDSSEHFQSVLKFRHVPPAQSSSDEETYSSKAPTPPPTMKEYTNPQLRQSRRSGIRSMRSKRWHLEMAEQYSQPCYQCPDADDLPPSQPKYSYSVISSPQDEANCNRRWVPPVHPTKHLLINDRPLMENCQQSSFDYSLVSNRRTSTSSTHCVNSTLVSESVLRGNSVECEPAVVSSSESETVETERTSTSDMDASPTLSSGRFSWSVSHLRSLYGDTNDKRSTPAREKINPSAQVNYV